jgi:hypothetical protein
MKTIARFSRQWLKEQQVIKKGNYVRHVQLKSPLLVKVDGRKRRGVIFK